MHVLPTEHSAYAKLGLDTETRVLVEMGPVTPSGDVIHVHQDINASGPCWGIDMYFSDWLGGTGFEGPVLVAFSLSDLAGKLLTLAHALGSSQEQPDVIRSPALN